MSAIAPWIAAQRDQLLAQRGHAWLLQGPSGLGQFELALELVRAWLCDAPSPHGACGQCGSCHAVAVHTHADLCVLMPETVMLALGWPLPEKAQSEIDDKKRKPSREIRVEAMRDAVEFCQRTSARGRGKAVLVYPAEQMNTITANALLKTLEEPPGDTRFVLASDAAHALPATIRSRCCAYSLAPVAEEVCAAYLKKHFPKEPEAARYAALFGGKIGSAKRCLEDAAGRTLLLDALKLAGLAEKQDVYGALALLSKYEKDRAGTQALLGLLLNVCSASLRGSEAAQSPVSPARAARCAGEAGKTARLLAGNVSGKLALTCLAARLTA